MKRLCALLLILFVIVAIAIAEEKPYLPWDSSTINIRFPGAINLTDWWIALPTLTGSIKWYNIIRANHGTLIGMSNTSTSGWSRPLNQAHVAQVNFDGTNDYVATSVNPHIIDATSPFTLCAQVYATGAGGNGEGTIITTRTSDAPWDGINFSWAGGRVRLYVQTFTDKRVGILGTATLSQSTWYHLCGVYTGSATIGGLTLYNNGAVLASGTELNDGAPDSLPTRLWRIGADHAATPLDMFQGSMNDIKVFNKALTAGEILSIYGQAKEGYPGLFEPVYFIPVPGFTTSQTVIQRRISIQ